MKKTLFLVGTLVTIGLFGVLPFLAMNAPIPFDMEFSHKIFYYHVPAAWMMFVAAYVAGIASVGYLKTRKPAWDDVGAASGELAVVLGAIVMTTGPLWGKAHWGVYWAWDAHQTTSLLLWVTFIAYTLVRRFGGPGNERLAAGLAVFGMVDVPLVYFAVNFWRTQHPSNAVARHMPASIALPLFLSLAAYTFLFVLAVAAKVVVRRGERQLEACEDLALELE
jgi:heme exporter protein C